MDDEAAIYYSKWKTLINILWLAVVPAAMFFFAVKSGRRDLWLIFSFAIIFFGALSLIFFRQLLNKKPALIISKQGIKILNSELVLWRDVRDERIICEYGSKGSLHHYLVFEHGNSEVKFSIDDLEISKTELEKLLIDYRDFCHYKKIPDFLSGNKST